MKTVHNRNILQCNIVSSKERNPVKKTIVSRSCSVPQCDSRSSDIPKPHFHHFPHEVEINPATPLRRAKWCLALRIGRAISKGLVVCSKHFQTSDYINPDTSRKLRLKKTAIPSRNLPVSENVSDNIEEKLKNSSSSQFSKRSKKSVKRLKRKS